MPKPGKSAAAVPGDAKYGTVMPHSKVIAKATAGRGGSSMPKTKVGIIKSGKTGR